MINQKLQDFDEDVKPLGDTMTQATIEIYNFISTRMLPTPTKIHYLFNLRDISKVRLTRFEESPSHYWFISLHQALIEALKGGKRAPLIIAFIRL